MNVPKRFFYNSDGNGCLLSHRGPMRPDMVTSEVDALVGTAITTLVLCVSYSDLVTYPSKVVSMYGWRDTPSNHTSPKYRWVNKFFAEVRRRGWDIPKMAMQRAHEMGLEFIPSMRMNDGHYAQKVPPTEHPLTGQWWLEHQDLIINPDAQWPAGYDQYLLDFQHQAVREYRLASAMEIIDRYGNSGFEMDWTRHPVYFRKGQAQPELITEMVRQIRTHVDALSNTREHRPLIVRVAASIENSLELGLDVAAWVREGLVDYIVPSSPSRYISFDMPIRAWKKLVQGAPVQVHASPDSAAPRGDGQATVEMYRAAASNYYAMGADGFYLFNLFCQGYPLADSAYLIMRDVSDPAALARRNKLFMATLDNWDTQTDTLPACIADPQRPAQIALEVGDDLDAARADSTLHRATLKVRLDRIAPEDQFEITLNGAALNLGTARVQSPNRAGMIQWNANTASWGYERQTLKGPWVWIELDLTDTLPKVGTNLVTVRVLSPMADDRSYDPVLTDVDLEVSYDFCGKD